MQFWNKLDDTLRQSPDIWFNLYLVLNDYRPAYLIECSHYDTKKECQRVMKSIRSCFPKLKITKEKGIERYFVHKKKIPEDVGEALGMTCAGDIDDSSDQRHGVRVNINDKNIYAEICATKDRMERAVEHLKSWIPAAEELDGVVPGGVEMDINTDEFYSMKFIGDKILSDDREWIRDHYDEIINYVYNTGGPLLVDKLRNNETDQYDKKLYDSLNGFVKILVLADNKELFSPLYPIDPDEYDTYISVFDNEFDENKNPYQYLLDVYHGVLDAGFELDQDVADDALDTIRQSYLYSNMHGFDKMVSISANDICDNFTSTDRHLLAKYLGLDSDDCVDIASAIVSMF